MKNRIWMRATSWGLALGLVALSGAAWAGEAEDAQKKVDKRRVVVYGPDGKRQVIEGDSPLMRRGYLGVGLTDLTPELRAHFGVPEGEGVMISSVESGSPAEKAGIKVGDILTSVDGQQIEASWDVRSKVRRLEDGQQVPVELWRNGRAQTVTVTAAEREIAEMDMGPLLEKLRGADARPMVLQMDRDELRKRFPNLDRMERGAPAPGRRLSSPREAELEKRLKELEKKLDELQKQLDKKN